MRYRAVRALHELGPKAKLAVPVLSEIVLNTTEPEATRNWAIKTRVTASAEDVYYGVRQLAREQLRKIDSEAADAAGI